jgi:superfamily I DNA/RNA helicase
MMEVITKPEVPPAVNEVRLMSLHKSKGLSSPFVFISGCVQGLLPKLADPALPPVQRASIYEEQRRLFYVGITRVKADPAAGRPGVLVLTYSQTMLAGLAMQAGIDAVQRRGIAYLQPSSFLAELGPSAPVVIAG